MTERENHAPEVRVADKRRVRDGDVGSSARAEAVDDTAAAVAGLEEAAPSEVPEPESPMDGLTREREEARAEAASYLDDLKRLKAEFENYRKRMVREQTQMADRAAAGMVERLLPILDNFELALLAADRTKDYEAMVRGVEIVFGELVELLQKEGLQRVDAVGKPFDPELHEAVMRGEGEGDELYVMEEMRAGYTLGGRIVRPAMVKVGARPRREDESEQ